MFLLTEEWINTMWYIDTINQIKQGKDEHNTCEPWQYYVKEKILDNKEAQSFKGRVAELQEIMGRPGQVRHP